MSIIFPEALEEDQNVRFVLAAIAAASRHRDPASQSSRPSASRPSTSLNVPRSPQVTSVNASTARVPASASAVPSRTQTVDIGRHTGNQPSTSRSGNHSTAHTGTSSTGGAPAPASRGSDSTIDDIDHLVDFFGDLATGSPPNVPQGITPAHSHYILVLTTPA